jgi:hypothetical protein
MTATDGRIPDAAYGGGPYVDVPGAVERHPHPSGLGGQGP